MKYKLLAIMFVALLAISFVAAYDLEVTSVSVDPSSPVVTQEAEYKVTVINLGPEDITGESITVELDYDNGDSMSDTLTDLAAGASESFYFLYTYNTANDYTIEASVSGMSNDTDSTNDALTKDITVVDATVDVSVEDLAITDALRNSGATATGRITNDGNVPITVIGMNPSDLFGSTDTIDSSDINILSPSTEIEAGSYKEFTVQVNIGSQVPDLYEGVITTVYNSVLGGDTIESDLSVTIENQAPTVDSIDNQIIVIGDTFTYDVVANDAENDPLTYSVNGPAGMEIDNVGQITWTATTAVSQTVTVDVFDGYDHTTTTFNIESKADVPEITVESTILLGGTSQERGEQVTKTFTVTNTGSQDLTDLTVEATTTSGSALPDKYNVNVVLLADSLAPGESTSGQITATIPVDQDAQKLTIGRVRVEGMGNTASTYDDSSLQMQAKSYLRITDVNIEVDGDDEDLSNGEVYDEIKEGDEVVLTVTVENIYTDDDNIEIENVYMVVEDDNDWNIDEESSEEDIKEDDDTDLEVRFTIDNDIDDDETTVTIEVYGDDEEESFEHYDEYTFRLEIDRERNEITIKSWSFERSVVSCTDSFAELEVRIENTGTDDQEEVTLEVVSDSDELDWHKRIRDIELDEDDDQTETFNIPIRSVEEGSYFIEINTYYDNSKKSDSEVITLDVVCNGGNVITPPTNDDDDDDDTIVIMPPTDIPTGDNSPVYGQPVTATKSFRTSNTYMIVLIAIVVVLILVVIGLLVRLFANKK